SEDSKNFLMSLTFEHCLFSISWKPYPPGQLPPSRYASQDVANFFRFPRSHVASPFAQTLDPDLGCTYTLSFLPRWTVQLVHFFFLQPFLNEALPWIAFHVRVLLPLCFLAGFLVEFQPFPCSVPRQNFSPDLLNF